MIRIQIKKVKVIRCKSLKRLNFISKLLLLILLLLLSFTMYFKK